MTRWIAALGALASVAAGCTQLALDPVDAIRGSSGTGGGGVDPPPDAGAPTALAIRFGDLHVPSELDWFQPGGTLDVDANALALLISTKSSSCAAPILAVPPDGTPCQPGDAFRQDMLVIPPALARPGRIDLTDSRIGAYAGVWTEDCERLVSMSESYAGELEILAIHDDTLSFELDSVPNEVFPTTSGKLVATSCGTLPSPAPPTPALAVPASSLPDAPGFTVSFDALYLFFGTAPATCSDPLPPLPCTGYTQARVALPPQLQQPGILALADPTLQAAYASSNEPATGCPQEDAKERSFVDGTVEILSIGSGAVAFRIYGSKTVSHYGVDGLYAAAICP